MSMQRAWKQSNRSTAARRLEKGGRGVEVGSDPDLDQPTRLRIVRDPIPTPPPTIARACAKLAGVDGADAKKIISRLWERANGDYEAAVSCVWEAQKRPSDKQIGWAMWRLADGPPWPSVDVRRVRAHLLAKVLAKAWDDIRWNREEGED